MLNIYIHTGCWNLHTITVEGSVYDDILGLINEWVESNPNNNIVMTRDYVLECYTPEEIEELIQLDNGNFIQTISHIEEV